MARIRTIKPEFFTSEQIVECSTSARLLFVGLWCFCDDGGVHPASIKRLKMEVFPGDAIADEEIQGMVDELKRNGLIIEFEAENERYWHVTGWDRHQKIDRPTKKYPRPDGQNSSSTRRVIVEHSTTPRDGMESNGMDSKSVHQEDARHPKGNGEIELKPKVVRFVKPTATEVSAYCREISSTINPQKFVDHYESNGWKVGRNAMKDWRAAVRNWSTTDSAGDGLTPHRTGHVTTPRIQPISEIRTNSLGGIIQ
ncbi:hypothetical protein [Schlesneria sp. DSM 10557]|uniref:hypothetical protein n=1 Tax=Schlesneria sp. DSM 10557 TaxID=3044399 RepID=UPI0035A0D197